LSKNQNSNLQETAQPQVRAVLVGIYNRDITLETAKEYLDELAFLATTAGFITVQVFQQALERPNSGTYIGSGKLDEIDVFVKANQIQVVIFDDDLSPSQIRNIDKILGIKVLDRSALILEIFSENARTAQSKVQVQLARLQYMLPRLTGMWQHLSREKGGIGMKGAGEKEIETDRRIIRDQIAKLKEDLKKIDRQSETRRKHRELLVRVSMAGYTNVGKSTLMNVLTKANVLAENKLFATLDSTVRKVVYEQTPFLLSDTVGFIRKLPHGLIESFKSTLDEVREADIIIHVVDVSHPRMQEQMEVVLKTLQEIHAGDKAILTVFNKADLMPDDVETLLRKYQPSVLMSAINKSGIDTFKAELMKLIRQVYKEKYPNLNFMEDYSM
jgi:GTP-binding protein HflX